LFLSVTACSRGDSYPIPNTPDTNGDNTAAALWLLSSIYHPPAATTTPIVPTEELIEEPTKEPLEAAQFLQGFLDAGGRVDWGWHMVTTVIPLCENKGHNWAYQPGYHISVAQFTPESWQKVVKVTGLSNSYNLYHVGYNAATWIEMIHNRPGSRGGWPLCWWY